MNSFLFSLNQSVKLKVSGEAGYIRARSDGLDRPNTYMVTYCNAQGVAAETWWNEDQLAAN